MSIRIMVNLFVVIGVSVIISADQSKHLSIRNNTSALYHDDRAKLERNAEDLDLNGNTFNDGNLWKSRYQTIEYFNPVMKNLSTLLEHLDLTETRTETYTYKSDLIYSRRTDTDTLQTYSIYSHRKKRSTGLRCSGLCKHSVCSWSMHWNEDRERVPQFIKYAECDSSICDFGFADLDFVATLKLSLDTRCEPVKTEVVVTLRGVITVLTNWPIACLCAKRRARNVILGQAVSNTQLRDEFTPQHDGRILHINDHVGHRRLIPERPDVRTLTRAQQRQLRRQERRHRQHTQSFEQVMERQRNNQ